MVIEMRYRGRMVNTADVDFIRQLIRDNAGASRRALSKKLCEAWQWKQANGAPRDMVCRGLLLMLERAGLILLPAVRFVPPNPFVERARPASVLIDTSELRADLSQTRPLEFQQVRRTAEEGLFNSLLEQYHYLGYTQPVGEQLKYVVWSGGRPLACLAWSSAPRHLGPRDRFIGWDRSARKRNIHFIAYNTRFLIMPWVQVPHLGSHVLGQMARRVPDDWQQMYGHSIYLAETFIDPSRFRGTCYRAANWIVVGETTGRGKDDHTNRPNRPVKQILVLPLAGDFRRLLSA
jgi:hypothetical protein